MAGCVGLCEPETGVVKMAGSRRASRKLTPAAENSIVTAHVRLAGEDPPASLVLAAAARTYTALTPLTRDEGSNDDYTLVDPGLTVVHPADPDQVPPPRNGLGYAGLTPEQRGVLLDWLADPSAPIARPYQDVYLAHLEVRMLEAHAGDRSIHGRMTALQAAPPWRRHAGLARAVMLGFYLYGDGPGLVNWLANSAPTDDLFDLGLSLQAQLETPITPAQLGDAMVCWRLTPAPPPVEVLRSRLDSLAAALGDEPLAYARAGWDEAARRPVPWRCLHRDLRLALPQPPVRPLIEPALADVLRVAARRDSVRNGTGADTESPNAVDPRRPSVAAEGTIVLEFQHSRSEYFDYVLDVARRMEGFSQLMDEDRHIIYRVTFRKHKLRQFWRIWDYVQSWNSTRIYADGEELEKWKIWPYSQYLR